jgi:hypothetical protein
MVSRERIRKQVTSFATGRIAFFDLYRRPFRLAVTENYFCSGGPAEPIFFTV